MKKMRIRLLLVVIIEFEETLATTAKYIFVLETQNVCNTFPCSNKSFPFHVYFFFLFFFSWFSCVLVNLFSKKYYIREILLLLSFFCWDLFTKLYLYFFLLFVKKRFFGFILFRFFGCSD